MTYQHERDAFIYRMGKEGVDLYDAREILKYAGVCQRAAEVDCSVESETIRAASLKASRRAELKIRQSLQGSDFRATFHGDPRGCVVHLLHPDHFEIGVPAQGYRAAQMSRMAR